MANASAAHQEPRSHAHFGAWHLIFIHPENKQKKPRHSELLMKHVSTPVHSCSSKFPCAMGPRAAFCTSCLEFLMPTSSCEVCARTCCPCATHKSSAALEIFPQQSKTIGLKKGLFKKRSMQLNLINEMMKYGGGGRHLSRTFRHC